MWRSSALPDTIAPDFGPPAVTAFFLSDAILRKPWRNICIRDYQRWCKPAGMYLLVGACKHRLRTMIICVCLRKLMLAVSISWCPPAESNCAPTDYESAALTRHELEGRIRDA